MRTARARMLTWIASVGRRRSPGIGALVLAGLSLLMQGQPAAQGQPGQDQQPKNPFQPTAQTLQEGMAAFRGNCAYCHGMDGRGARGPDLTGVFRSGRTEEGLFQIVKAGIPGSEMPPAGVFLPENDIWKTLMYVRTLGVPEPNEPPRGDAANGEKIFWARCGGCHRVNERGGVIGPDLSRIGVARARAALVRQIRGAVEDIRPGYEPMTVTTPDGRTIRGTRKNEDLFSVQIMDSTERLQGYVKSDVRTVVREKRSVMPAYGTDQLNERDLDDLLRYLGTLRGQPSKTP